MNDLRLTRSPIIPSTPRGDDLTNPLIMHSFLRNMIQLIREGRELSYDDLVMLKAAAEALLPVGVPASAGATGTAGQWSYDSSYFYICTATNTWKRVGIAGW